MPTEGDKICVLCGQSCAGQPRTKNERGQYAHQACAKAKQDAAKASPAPAGPGSVAAMADMGGMSGLGDDDDDLMGALLDDIPAESVAYTESADGVRHQTGCPGCGAAAAPGAVVCLGCGYNHKTGKAGKTKVTAAPKASGAVTGLAGAAGGYAAAGTMFLVGSVLGGGVAAAAGAVLWAAVAIGTGYEVSWIAVGVGALCGFGTALGSRGQTGMMTGGIAVIFAILGICVGKFAAISYIIDDELAGSSLIEEVAGVSPEDFVLQIRIDEVVQERLDGSTLTEPERREYIRLIAEGEYPDDYPAELVTTVQDEWAARTDSDRSALIREQEDLLREAVQAGGFIASFGILDILFFLIAIAAAFKLGSGGD